MKIEGVEQRCQYKNQRSYLSRNSEGDHFAIPFGVQLEQTGYLVYVNITATLGHEANAPLWFTTLVSVDVMDERCFVSDLKVTYVAVTLW